MANITRMLTISDVAERLGIGKSLAYQLVSSGRLAATKISTRAMRVSERELERFIEDRRVESASPAPVTVSRGAVPSRLARAGDLFRYV